MNPIDEFLKEFGKFSLVFLAVIVVPVTVAFIGLVLLGH
jgi:hypothetical protein